METALTNTPSAVLAASCRPLEDPLARKMTGVRCGEGSVNPNPGTVKYLPWWLMSCTRLGSTYTPVSRSMTTALSSHEPSHSL